MNKSSGHIDNAIKKYIKKVRQRFHTPGHKGDLNPYDITEIEDCFPADCIKNAQNDAAAIYGAEFVRFLTLGSSIGNKAAIMAHTFTASTGKGKAPKIICEEGCHQSVLDGITLSGAVPVIIKGGIKDGLVMPLTYAQIASAIKENPDTALVVLTSPDYYGINAMTGAAKAVKDAGKLLHIDAAHGAHYPLRKDLFDNDIYLLADSAVFSVHKTLHSYTQTSLLAVYNKKQEDVFDKFLLLLGTSSPSYLMLSAIENAINYSVSRQGHYSNLKDAIKAFKQRIPCAASDDFTRVVVDASKLSLTGRELYSTLKDSGIVAEKFDDRYVIFIVTLKNTKKDILLLEKEIIKACQIKSKK